MPHKASSKSKLKEDKKWSCLGLIAYGFKEDSEGKFIKYKKLNNGKTKLDKYNK